MGLSSAFLVHRAGGEWINEEQSRLSAVELERLAGEGPSLAARALHSDACFVLGRVPGAAEWRWVFGESSARSYIDEFDPSRWIDTEDPDELEESRDERVVATASAIIAWAVAAGLNAPGPQDVRKALAAGYVFAEDGFFALLDTLGIDALLREQTPAEPANAMHVEPKGSWQPEPPYAIAIDRSSPEWADIDAYHLEFRFGEPPCILRWQGIDFVLSDPPVSLGTHLGLRGERVAVPAEYGADFQAAASWARANVGEAGEPPTGTRPLLVIDDPPPRLRGWQEMPLSYLYDRADNAQVAVWLEFEDALDGEVAADLASSFYDRLVAATVASVGETFTVTYGRDEATKGWGLLVGGVTSRSDGHIGVTKATEPAWRRVVSKLRDGELVAAECSVRRTDAFGRTWESFSYMEASFSIWRNLEDDLDSPPRVLKISVDLPYFQHIFRPVDAEAFARSALASLPLRRGYVHVGRWADSTDHWIDILPTSEVSAAADYALTETHGHLMWLQRTTEPPTAIVEI